MIPRRDQRRQSCNGKTGEPQPSLPALRIRTRDVMRAATEGINANFTKIRECTAIRSALPTWNRASALLRRVAASLATHHHTRCFLDRIFDRCGRGIRTPRPWSLDHDLPQAARPLRRLPSTVPATSSLRGHSRTSFTISPVVKPKSKVRGRIARGNLSRLAEFLPSPH